VKHTVVLITGWACPPQRIAPLAHQLETRLEVKVVCLDLLDLHHPSQPGGSRDMPSPYTVRLNKHIQHIPGSALLIGWSMGGMIALEQAACFPDEITGVVLIGSTVRFCRSHDWPHGQSALRVQAMMGGLKIAPGRTLSRFYRECAHPLILDKATGETYVNEAMVYDPDQLHDGLKYLSASDLRDLTSNIEVPTLLLHGREDAIIPCSAAEWLHSKLDGSRFTEFAGMGHDLPVRMPEELAEEIAGFVNGDAVVINRGTHIV